jgi:hypothetical protein
MRNFVFWFCVPWAVFFGIAAVLYFSRHPENLLLLLPIIVLIGFASRAEYVKLMARADARPGKAARPQAEPASDAAPPFNPRGPGQFTSFAFRHGLPPGTLKRRALMEPPKALPTPPKRLPPPSDDG